MVKGVEDEESRRDIGRRVVRRNIGEGTKAAVGNAGVVVDDENREEGAEIVEVVLTRGLFGDRF